MAKNGAALRRARSVGGGAAAAAVAVVDRAEPERPPLDSVLVADERVHTEVSLITPLQAERLLKEAGYGYQRKMREWHVKEYAEYMRRGEWKPNTVLTFNAVRDGATGDDALFLIDGQHRLCATIESGKAQQFVVLVERVDTLDEVAENYTKYDSNLLRTANEKIATLVHGDETTLNESEFRYILAAAKIIKGGFTDKHQRDADVRSGTSLAALLRDWQIPAEKLAEAVGHFTYGSRGSAGSGLLRLKLRTAPILAVALVTVRYQADKAIPFWQSVISNDGLRVGTPEHALAQFLFSMERNSKVGWKRLSRYVAAAWNRYYRGQALTMLKVVDENSPIEIAGTPFKG